MMLIKAVSDQHTHNNIGTSGSQTRGKKNIKTMPLRSPQSMKRMMKQPNNQGSGIIQNGVNGQEQYLPEIRTQPIHSAKATNSNQVYGGSHSKTMPNN